MTFSAIRRTILLGIANKLIERNQGFYVPAAISARHVHLSQQDVEILFGKGYALKKLRDLNQPEQFVCHEKVTLIGDKGSIEGIRVLGPVRSDTQVELSLTDCYKVGIKPDIRMSGDLNQTPGAALVGPAGSCTIRQGVIIAARHLHISPEQAQRYQLKNGDVIQVRKTGIREIILGNIVVQIGRASWRATV